MAYTCRNYHCGATLRLDTAFCGRCGKEHMRIVVKEKVVEKRVKEDMFGWRVTRQNDPESLGGSCYLATHAQGRCIVRLPDHQTLMMRGVADKPLLLDARNDL